MNTSLSKLLRKVPAAIIAFSVVFMSFPAQPVAAAAVCEEPECAYPGFHFEIVGGTGEGEDFTVRLINTETDDTYEMEAEELLGNQAFLTVPGTYRFEVVDELLENYVLSFPQGNGTACTAGGVITVGAGSEAACNLVVTATEEESDVFVAFTLFVEGGPATVTDFTVRITNQSTFVESTLQANGDQQSFEVPPGTYTYDLVPNDFTGDYELSFVDGNCTSGGVITVNDENDGNTCYLSNTFIGNETGYLRVASDAANYNGGTWLGQEGVVMIVNGEGPLSQNQILELPTGTSTFQANEIPGYLLEYIGDCDENGVIYIPAWNDDEEGGPMDPEDYTGLNCYAHYDDIAPKVTVIKHVVSQFGEDPEYNGLSASDFTMKVRNVFFDGESTSTNEIRLQGDEVGTSTNELWAGYFEVRESDYIRDEEGEDSEDEHFYSKSFSNGDNNSEGYICSGEIGIGEEVTCVVNNYAPLLPTENIRIKKNVINDDGSSAQAHEFLMKVHMTLGEDSHDEYVAGSENGVTVAIPVGASYTVTESHYFGQLNDNEGYEESDRLHRYGVTYEGACSGTIVEPEEDEDGYYEPVCVITNNDPEIGSQGGGNGVPPPIPQNLPPHGFADGSAPSGNGSNGGQVLGIKEDAPTTAETIATCRAEDPDTELLPLEVNAMLVKLGLSRDEVSEQKYDATLVPRILPTGINASDRAIVRNFTTYGPNSIMHLGAGERAGAIASYVAVYGHMPQSDCDWQNVLRIAKGYVPVVLSSAHELEVMKDFVKVYGRNADRAQQMEDVTFLIMSYGLRPRVRSLVAERQAIVIFRRIYGHNPATTREWDVMRGIAYGGLQVPGSAAIVR